MKILSSFAPILNEQTHCLILGSMPGQKSLDQQQYYAHPQNSFWWVMGQIFSFDPALDYSQRCTQLLANGVGLWDVLAHCQRLGSLDSKINAQTEQANDLVALIEAYPNITHLCFNGQKAKQVFQRYLAKDVLERFPLKTTLLPSSSPAHATLSKHDKLLIWRAALKSKGRK